MGMWGSAYALLSQGGLAVQQRSEHSSCFLQSGSGGGRKGSVGRWVQLGARVLGCWFCLRHRLAAQPWSCHFTARRYLPCCQRAVQHARRLSGRAVAWEAVVPLVGGTGGDSDHRFPGRGWLWAQQPGSEQASGQGWERGSGIPLQLWWGGQTPRERPCPGRLGR